MIGPNVEVATWLDTFTPLSTHCGWVVLGQDFLLRAGITHHKRFRRYDPADGACSSAEPTVQFSGTCTFPAVSMFALAGFRTCLPSNFEPHEFPLPHHNSTPVCLNFHRLLCPSCQMTHIQVSKSQLVLHQNDRNPLQHRNPTSWTNGG